MSIRYTQGNLLDATADALVNTVNEVGVMGKGIALQFRDTFPESARAYEQAAKAGHVHVGTVLLSHGGSLLGPRWIIHFPTKKHWRNPSQLSWVREGLQDLVRVIKREGIRSIAIPPLGCGNGGLAWDDVRPEIECALASLPDVDVTVFEPTERYQTAPKRSGVEALTVARALIAELIRRYSVLGLECSLLEVHKLAWFLHRAVERRSLTDPLDLQFAANRYGPYSHRLSFLLNALDGSYLHSEKRLPDAQPLDVLWFEESKRETIATFLASSAASAFIPALDDATAVIDGFESPFGLELLATVDWLLSHEDVAPTVEGLREGMARWPHGEAAAQRKLRIFDDRVLALALERLGDTPFASTT